MEMTRFLVLMCLILSANCAKKSKIEKRMDALENLFQSKMYLLDEKLDIGRQDREILMNKLNETMMYLEKLVQREGKTHADTGTKGKKSDLDVILNKIEELSDIVKLNDKVIDKLSESFVRIKRGVRQEKVARKSDASAVIKQLNEIQERQNEMASSVLNVINAMHEKQVAMDASLTTILNNQASIQDYLQTASNVQLEIVKTQDKLLSRVTESSNKADDMKQSTAELQRKIDMLTEDVSDLGVKVHNLNTNTSLQEQLTKMQDRLNLLIPSVRLVGGSSPLEGRVEITYGGRQGTVCDDGWVDNDAKVVCRMLGFSGGTAFPGPTYSGGHSFGEGSGEILLDEVQCDGNEQSLFDCKHRGIGIENCEHTEDAGVKCDP